MNPKLTIMILTQPSRTAFLSRLLDSLTAQAGIPPLECPLHTVSVQTPNIDLDIRFFDRAMNLGANRQAMREQARGLYSCFIDDDDLVADDYIARILPLLDGTVDYIGFQLQAYIDGDAMLPTFHSLKYDNWWGDNVAWYRDISHVNPIRTELALRVNMNGGPGEDSRWSDGLRELGCVKAEHYIDKIMYHYYFRSTKNDPVSSEPPSNTESKPPCPPCPKCKATCTTVFSNGIRCNQCGHNF